MRWKLACIVPAALGLVVLALGAETSPANAPGVVPDFVVKPVAAPFKLSEHRGRFVALHFLLKTECPLCLRHTHTYAKRASELPDVVNVFLKPDTEEDIQRWLSSYARGGEPTIPIYRDPDAALARRFGIPDGYKFHGQTVHYPALVLIDPEGREAFRYVGKNNSDRFSFDKLKAKVAELTPRTK